MTHTPGPWKAKTIPGDYSKWEVRDSKGKSITGWGRVTQTRDNARLIAAAPDMLAALKGILDIDNPPWGEPGHVDFNTAIVMARAAVAKSEGDTDDN